MAYRLERSKRIMKNWLKSNKWAIIFSTLGTLLPIAIGLLLWDQLPGTMATHWGVDGAVDGTSSKWVGVFVLPLIMAGFNLLCILATGIDPKQAEKNRKVMQVVFWIMPIVSILSSCAVYMAALGKAFQMAMLLPLLLGAMFIFIGNYLPKAAQNRFYGIKLSWTLHNEENWNKTHRLAGKLWVVGGLLILPTVLLPLKWMVVSLLIVTFAMILLPIIYSYCIYRKHRAQGISYNTHAAKKGDKIAKVITIVMVSLVLCFVAVLMFTGDITYTFEEDRLCIDATYDGGMAIAYDAIDSLELRENFTIGMRLYGFASARLSMGSFTSDEFTNYTLYSYNGVNTAVVIGSDGKWLILTGKTAEESQVLYNTLLEKTGK